MGYYLFDALCDLLRIPREQARALLAALLLCGVAAVRVDVHWG